MIDEIIYLTLKQRKTACDVKLKQNNASSYVGGMVDTRHGMK